MCEPPCIAPAFCHGTTNPTCETIAYTFQHNTQCADFITPHDFSLRTLAAAEEACAQDSACTGVSDLYCNGMVHDNDYYVLCNGYGRVDNDFACVWNDFSGSSCGDTVCEEPSICHGDESLSNLACETISYTQYEAVQCESFLEDDPSLTTLAAAEEACAANDACGGVSDLYCNGMHPDFPDDHYALCDGAAVVDHASTCLFMKEALPPSPPADGGFSC